jgi:hypothetical protein
MVLLAIKNGTFSRATALKKQGCILKYKLKNQIKIYTYYFSLKTCQSA